LSKLYTPYRGKWGSIQASPAAIISLFPDSKVTLQGTVEGTHDIHGNGRIPTSPETYWWVSKDWQEEWRDGKWNAPDDFTVPLPDFGL
jgi:hypothetical protein